MSKNQWKALVLTFTGILTTAILVIAGMFTTTFGQPTSSVGFLSDVKPTDYYFSALQELTERYSCVEGYPDGNFRGNKSLTRGEFILQLNTCFKRIRELTESACHSDSSEKIDKLELRITELQKKLESNRQKKSGENESI